MSFLQQVQKVSDAHYVLPRIGDMRTDVHAYLSDTLFEQTNEKLWIQAARAAAYPGSPAVPRPRSSSATLGAGTIL